MTETRKVAVQFAADAGQALSVMERAVAEVVAIDNARAVRQLREWCDKTQAAASSEQSEPAFQARMELVDEVRSLLPPVQPGTAGEVTECATTETSDPQT